MVTDVHFYGDGRTPLKVTDVHFKLQLKKAKKHIFHTLKHFFIDITYLNLYFANTYEANIFILLGFMIALNI